MIGSFAHGMNLHDFMTHTDSMQALWYEWFLHHAAKRCKNLFCRNNISRVLLYCRRLIRQSILVKSRNTGDEPSIKRRRLTLLLKNMKMAAVISVELPSFILRYFVRFSLSLWQFIDWWRSREVSRINDTDKRIRYHQWSIERSSDTYYVSATALNDERIRSMSGLRLMIEAETCQTSSILRHCRWLNETLSPIAAFLQGRSQRCIKKQHGVSTHEITVMVSYEPAKFISKLNFRVKVYLCVAVGSGTSYLCL
jgi:hypothetical protein